MKTNPREIMVYYHPESSSGKKTVAFAKSLSRHVKTYSFTQNPSTNTSWGTILKFLNMEAKEILNKAHPDYQAKIKGREFDRTGWLDILQNNPHLIKAPIAIKGSKAVLCSNPTDIYKL